MVRMPAMKTIAKTGKLQLNKETLRSLSNEQLESVNGASGHVLCNNRTVIECSALCPDTDIPGGVLSMPNPAACHPGLTVITHLDPQP